MVIKTIYTDLCVDSSVKDEVVAAGFVACILQMLAGVGRMARVPITSHEAVVKEEYW